MIRWSLGLVCALALLGGCEAASAACNPQAASNVNATCSGTTSNQAGGAPGTSAGINGYGTGVQNNLGVTVLSGATVTGSTRGVFFDAGTLFNSGTVSGASFGIFANNAATVTNFGTIFTGGNSAVRADIAKVTNSGTISGGVFGIFGVNTATVTNSGTIHGGSSGIEADTAIVTNFGTISSTGSFGVHATNAATVTNFGTISGFYGVYGPTVTVTNLGAIVGNNAAIAVLSSGTVVNSGTVSGTNFGILANGSTTVINSGAIIGGGTAAIEFSGAPDTLTLLPGSRIIGAINLGGGGDAVNFRGGNHNLTFDTLAGATVTGTTPFAVSGTQAVAIDPTPFAAAGTLLTDFTRGVWSLVPMLGQATPAAGGGALAFAAPDAGSRIDETFANIPGLSAYASDRAVFKNPRVLYADGTAIWAGGFAGERIAADRRRAAAQHQQLLRRRARRGKAGAVRSARSAPSSAAARPAAASISTLGAPTATWALPGPMRVT